MGCVSGGAPAPLSCSRKTPSSDDEQARAYIDAVHIGPVLNSELLLWKSTMHIILHSITHKQPRRAKRPRVPVQEGDEEDGPEHDEFDFGLDDYDGYNAPDAADQSSVHVADAAIAMTPRLFSDAECSAMTQWKNTCPDPSTGARR